MALALNYKRLKKLGARPIDRHGWEKPTEDLVKLNVDAAFDINSGAGGTCVIIRDHFGSFVSGGRWSLQFVEDERLLHRDPAQGDLERMPDAHVGWHGVPVRPERRRFLAEKGARREAVRRRASRAPGSGAPGRHGD